MMELLDLEPEFWREGAACASHPEIDFFASPDSASQVIRAKAVCMQCPVLDDCLGFAIETNQPDGIWGGYTAKERSKIRRQWLDDVRRAS
jgi:WhiB family redox-sensing transcriptional regulator